MHDAPFLTPLAAYEGRKPPAPAWFERAIATEPERDFVEIEGARIETLAWGERGKPGLLLLHGGAAHADWYSFIAPFFAAERRVVAISFSGMGLSDWRPAYAFDQFVREAHEAGRFAGLYEGGRPVVFGHSFGGRITVGLAHEFGEELAAAVLVDPPLFAPRNVRPPQPPGDARAPRLQPTFEAAVARFRLAPPQPCEHPYILDHIARLSLREATDAAGAKGWTWRFDPNLWARMGRKDAMALVSRARCPLGIVRGERSKIFRAEDAEYVAAQIGPGAPYVTMPETDHHVMFDQPLAFVSVVETFLKVWPPAWRA